MVSQGKPFPDDVPSVVIRLCLELRLTAPTVEHRERLDCQHCGDSGTHFAWVCGYDVQAKDPTWRYANVACTCGNGARWAQDRTKSNGRTLRGLPVFDASQHVMTTSRHHRPEASDVALLAESGLPGAASHAAWLSSRQCQELCANAESPGFGVSRRRRSSSRLLMLAGNESTRL